MGVPLPGGALPPRAQGAPRFTGGVVQTVPLTAEQAAQYEVVLLRKYEITS